MTIYKTNGLFGQLDLSALRHFFWISTYGGFTKAARATGISQPSLSLGLQKLEKSLGMTLIDRTSKDFQLTEAGKTLLAFCQGTEGFWESTVGKLGIDPLSATRRIKIGASFSIGFQPLLELCARAAEMGPKLELDVISKGSYELLGELVAGSIDAAVLPDDVHDPRLSFTQLLQDQIILLTSAQTLPLNSVRNWRMLLEENTLISYPRETPLRAVVDRITTTEGLQFRSTLSVDGVESMKLLVKNGIGMAFMLRSLAEEELASKNFVEVKTGLKLPRLGAVLAVRRGETGDELTKFLLHLMGHKPRSSKQLKEVSS